MAELPTGTVTVLFTDVEGSTRLWEQHPEAMRQALARHDALIETAVEQHAGLIVRPRGEGDSRFAVFSHAVDAAPTPDWPPVMLFPETVLAVTRAEPPLMSMPPPLTSKALLLLPS